MSDPGPHCPSLPSSTPSACSWLIAIAFWLAGGFIKSGLGNRIAYGLVAAFGKTTLGLTYSLVLGEALLSPAIPSVAARAGEGGGQQRGVRRGLHMGHTGGQTGAGQ
jgi:di/tricarboxylate transporter